MSEEIEVRHCYFRDAKDQKKMTFAFWWSVFKLALMIIVMLGAAVSPVTTVVLQRYTIGLLVSIAISAFFTVGIYKIKKGDWRNSVAFGVCDLLFSSLVTGILLLTCRKDV